MTWQDELRKIPAPEPSEDLLKRILASRAAGVRVALPAGGRPSRMFRYAAAAVVVGIVATVAVVGSHRPAEYTGNARWEADVGLVPSDLFAQEPEGRLVKGSYPAVEDLEAARLTPGTWTYQVRTIIDAFVTDTATTNTTTIDTTTFDERPVVLLTSAWASRAFNGIDTLIVERDHLRPLRRHCCGHSKSRTFDFAGLDVGPLFLTRPARDYAGTRMNPNMSLNIGLVNLLYLKPVLQTLPLHDGWRGSLYSRALPGPWDPLPIDVRVAGHGSQTVPAGTFQCWTVRLTLPPNGRALTVWINRRDQSVVRVRQEISDGAIEEVLVAREPNPPAP